MQINICLCIFQLSYNILFKQQKQQNIMDLIDIYYEQIKRITVIQQSESKVKLSFLDHFKNFTCTFTGCQFNFEVIIDRISNLLLIAKINVVNLKQIKIYVSLIDNKHLNARNNVDKIILIHQFLKMNYNIGNATLLINPKNGNFCLGISVSLSQQLQSNQFIEIVTKIFENIKQQSKNLFNNIANILQKNTIFIKQNRFQKATYNLKRCIRTAPFYAWNMLRTMTQSKKQKLKFGYLTLRNEFVEKHKNSEQNFVIIQISKILIIHNAKDSIRFQNLSLQEQRAIKQNYLPILNNNKKSKLIIQINLSQQNVRKLMKDKLCQIQCYQLGNIGVLLVAYPSTYTHALAYQQQILSKLPNNQFIGLAKYYIIKNYPELTKNCVITNLNSGFLYYRYLEKNKTSISIYTKLHLIHQLLLILKYLNKYGIVYHNLDPKNILIKKGLFLKASNFTNAYHSQIDINNIRKFHQPFRTILPYVSNYENYVNHSFGDEKADIFSFGMILYQTLYGKTPYILKNSKFQESDEIKKILKPPLISLQKQNNIVKQLFSILTYASLECINHNNLYNVDFIETQNNNLNDSLSKAININCRPHLEWMIIIVKWISQLFQQKLF